jgi:hypothetical protein
VPHSGVVVGVSVLAADLGQMVGDGVNLYQYCRGNPLLGDDPSGLAWDPFDMVDDYLAEDAASKGAFLMGVIGAAHVTAYMGAYAASWMPGAGGILGGTATAVMGTPAALQGSMLLQVMNAADNIRLGRAAAKLASKMGSMFVSMSKQYAQRSAGYATKLANELGVKLGVKNPGHHLIPMYMGGAQYTKTGIQELTRSQHDDLHRMINDAGRRFDIPTKQSGTAAVEEWLTNTPNGQDKLREALLDAYVQFDEKYGTNLLKRVVREIGNQGW